MKKKIKTPIYNLTMQFNGETYKKRTNDVKKTILSLKPLVLFTESYLTVTFGKGKDKQIRERKLNLIQGKRLFSSDDTLTVFILNLLLA